MTADPQDGQVTSTFCFKFSGEDVDGKWKEKETKMVFRHDAPKKRRGDMELKLTKLKAALEEKEAERWKLAHDNKMMRRTLGGKEVCTMCQSKDVDNREAKNRRNKHDRLAARAVGELEETEVHLAEQTQLVAQLTEQQGVLTKELAKLSVKVEQQRGVVERQMAKVQEAREREKQMAKSTVSRESYEGVAAQLEAARALEQALRTAAEELKWEHEDLEAQLEETENKLSTANLPGRGRHADKQAAEYFQKLRPEIGMMSKYSSVPARVAESEMAKKLSARHIAAVLDGRGEGDNINLIADALKRAGYLERLLDEADRVQPLLKGIVKRAVNKTQTHWTARHAVHVWDRLELSRSQMETLRHLLSHVYDAAANAYVPIKAWTNPNDDDDFVLTATLAGRWAREKEFDRLASKMNIVVGANGRCERDAIECTSLLYSNFVEALRRNYSTDRPAQPILFLDGTGGALGRGICHGEMGCADFVAVGDADTKQSRATLAPLFLYEGNDHAGPLRANLDLAISSYNKVRALPTRTA